MSFLAPMMLFGGLAVSIPLALHFFYKARHRPLNWAAMKFLRLSIEQTSRRLKFQELILLILRCLALLLLALALARLSCVGSAAGRSEGVDAIFVFDTSFSMGARDGEQTRLERAKAAARSIIDNLPPNSTVQIFTSAGADRAAPIKFTATNLDQARNVVDGISLTSMSGDILPGLIAAQEALDRGSGSNKEIYLFTDMQKSDWDRQAGALRGKAAEVKQRATLIIVRCSNPERQIGNAAIVDISIPDSLPVAETRLPVTIQVRNTGKKPLLNLPIRLEVDGAKQEGDSGLIAKLEPGDTIPITITAKLGKAGPRLLTAKLGGAVAAVPGGAAASTQVDDLPGDDRYDKLILVRDKIRVLLVDGNPDPRDSRDSGSHYVKNALVPVPESLKSSYFVKVAEVNAREASAAQLSDSDICILINTPTSAQDKPGIDFLSREFQSRLDVFVRRGGSLILSAGDFIVPAKLNQSLGSGGLGLLPFDLTEVATAGKDQPFHPAPDTAAAGTFLAKFREMPYSAVTADVDVHSVMGVNEQAGSGQVLLRLDNGKPLVCSKPVGEGEVLYVTTTLDARWTNWPSKTGSYLAMIRLALVHLTGKSIRVANRVAGELLQFNPGEAAKGFELEKPDKTRTLLGKAQGGEAQKLLVSTSDTAVAGEYLIVPEGETAAKAARFAVIPDLKESDNLDSLSDAAVQEYIGFKPVMVSAGSEAESQVGAERARREWTVWILLALLLVVVAETGWAWFCGRAW